MGAVVAAATLGSASPHLVNVVVPGIPWRTLVLVCSSASFGGGLLALLLLRPGPHLSAGRQHEEEETEEREEDRAGLRETVSSIAGNHELLCAIAAYSGHNWELYGMWSSFPSFALRSARTVVTR